MIGALNRAVEKWSEAVLMAREVKTNVPLHFLFILSFIN